MDQLDLIESLWLSGDYARGDELAEGLFGRGGQVISFNPNQHPRDAAGKFAGLIGHLKPGDRVRTPGGVTVTRTRHGYHVRAARARSRDPHTHHTDPVEAAGSALALDKTPREPGRIGGRLHRKGAKLGRRDLAALPKGAAVVIPSGDFGRMVGIERSSVASGDRAVVELDPRNPARSSQPHVARVPLQGIASAVPAEGDSEGSHQQPHEESPGKIDSEVRSGLKNAAKHLGLGPAGDALHFLEDVANNPRNDPVRERVLRAEADARRQRSAGAQQIARANSELDSVERQLRRAGITPSSPSALRATIPPGRLGDGTQVSRGVRNWSNAASPGRVSR